MNELVLATYFNRQSGGIKLFLIYKNESEGSWFRAKKIEFYTQATIGHWFRLVSVFLPILRELDEFLVMFMN